MKCIKIFTLFFLFIIQANVSGQHVLTNVIVEGQNYTIQIEDFNKVYNIWARKNTAASSNGDIHICRIDFSVGKQKAMSMLCRGKEVIDRGKTVLGCGSVVGTAVCFASGAGGGTAVLPCSVTVSYGVSTGFVDCISGVSGAISDYFENEDVKNTLSSASAWSGASPGALVTTVLDKACEDFYNN